MFSEIEPGLGSGSLDSVEFLSPGSLEILSRASSPVCRAVKTAVALHAEWPCGLSLTLGQSWE